MKKVAEFLTANPVQYLATVSLDGKAKCRPFMFCFERDGKLWFCTNNQKDESYYYSLNLYYSGTTAYAAYKARNSSGQIIAVYGVN